MANNTDIYEISSEIEELQRKYIDEDQDILSVGLYGYLADQFATITQNSIYRAAEWGNEAFPTRARFEKTILSNAITYNVNNINATPAKMDAHIGIIKADLDALLDKFPEPVYVISKDTLIKVENIIFRLEYDMKIVRKKKLNGDYIYYAMNLIDEDKVLYSSPYLPAPIFINYSGDKYIFFETSLKQMELTKVNRRLITNNLLDNKSIDFNFKDQLYKFEVRVKESDGTIVKLEPIFEGETVSNLKYCRYYYTTADSIRIKFSRTSYIPPLNSEIMVDVYTTIGSKGNFRCDYELLFTANYRSKQLHGVVLPKGTNKDGNDRKTIEELKNIIPKERQSRGILSNDRDLENYFNIIDSNTRIKFFKKRHNQIERSYYSYLLVKDSRGNIIPTNTVNLNLLSNNFASENKYSYIIPPNVPMVYNNGSCSISNDTNPDNIAALEQTGFVYSCPFIINVNKKPLFVSYYLNIMNDAYDFNYMYINTNSDNQFITSKLNIYKNHIADMENYYVSFVVKSNINEDIYEVDKDTGEKRCKLKPVLVLSKSGFKYYIEGEVEPNVNLTTNNINKNTYTVLFKLKTNNVINSGIIIQDLFQYGTRTKVPSELPEQVDMEVLLYLDSVEGGSNDDGIVDLPHKSYEKYVLTNRLVPKTKVNLYYDYSDVINSVSTIEDTISDNVYDFRIKAIPVVKYSYMQDVTNSDEFIKYIYRRKIYIDYALERLANNFTIDFKFFNTYGPSKIFKVSRKDELLDRVNVKIKFAYRPKLGANSAIVELMMDETKEYIENINTINNLHVTNLIRHLKDKFDSDIDFIEFISFNDYDSSYQYIEKQDDLMLDTVPEFLNVNLNKDDTPDIEFQLV